ncbi:uncharacterized protein G2W53_014452 [Senna tora]|uniref:Uncharacterized protein n=1 Tax=Senna tora TaxID=362788 RepID=A0A834WTI7_9FABA|nr:uncharacterized protein G2W53_014452 [Senna tora]
MAKRLRYSGALADAHHYSGPKIPAIVAKRLRDSGILADLLSSCENHSFSC